MSVDVGGGEFFVGRRLPGSFTERHGQVSGREKEAGTGNRRETPSVFMARCC